MEHNLRVDYTGSQAINWMNSLGWEVTRASSDQPLRVIYDRIVAPDFVVGRFWHTPMSLRAVAPGGPGKPALIVLALSGRQSIEIDGAVHPLQPPELIVNASRTPFEIHSEETSAHAFFWVPGGRVAPWVDSLARIQPVLAGTGYRETVVSAAMSALNSDFAPNSPAHATWAAGMQQLVLALVQDTLHTTVVAPWPALAIEAKGTARTNATDPTYSVAKLARDLRISPTHLHRVMQPTGITPAELIRLERLHIASALLDGHHPRGEELERIARVSGFSSARALKFALERQKRE